MWARGTKSPLAPTDPWLGTTGITFWFTNSTRSRITSGRMPEWPFMRALALRIIMAFTTSPEKGSPTPQLWLRIRLRWSSATLSREMDVSANLPKPVLMP